MSPPKSQNMLIVQKSKQGALGMGNINLDFL